MTTSPFPRERFSFLAHTPLPLCNPISRAKHDRLIELLALPPGARVLDVGAGKGTLLLDLIERRAVTGTAVEPAPLFADTIEREAHKRALSRSLTLIRTPFAEARPALKEPFDCAVCIGSTQAMGSTTQCVRTLRELTRPGGLAVLGAGYWKKPPDAEYLTALATTAHENATHAENIALLAHHGLTPLWATTAADDEWDEYEWAYARAIEDFARDNPEDPDAHAVLQRAHTWRAIVARWGRDTLGFALYLARRTHAA